MTRAAVILAGGRSTRMGGGDKALLTLGQKPVLAHVADTIRPQVDALAINANGDAARFATLGLAVLPDAIVGYRGPLAGIHAAMIWGAALPSCPAVLTLAGDTPFPPADLFQRLSDAAQDGTRIAVAKSDGRRHPVFALWPAALADALADFLEGPGTGRVSAFIESQPFTEVEFGRTATGVDPFFNVNTPDDLEEARRIADGARR